MLQELADLGAKDGMLLDGGARGRWLLAKGATGVSAGVLFCGRPKNEACAFCPPDVYSVESLIFQGGVHAKSSVT
jgi:hypothetical protein